jgi:hypothetical protein
MKSYLQKTDLHYYSQNSEKPVMCRVPPDKPVEDIFNSPEDLGFSVINVRQMTAT